MKKLAALSFFLFLVLLFSKSVLAAVEPPPEIFPTPEPCACTPGEEEIRCDYDGQIPKSWCCQGSQDANCPDAWKGKGMGAVYVCNDDCQNWSYSQDICTENNQCAPAQPQITPVNYSLEKSVGDFNEYTEKGVHSGTRSTGIPIDQTDPNNYGAVAALVPAGGPNHELRAAFVKKYGSYEVVLGDGTTKTAREIWDNCTNNANPDNWQAYQDKLENCPDWGFVPLTYRRLANQPTPAIQTREAYFKDKESPFVLSWSSLGVAIQWVIKFFQDLTCNFLGLFCLDSSLPLRNPDNAPGWTAGKANIPAEATDNAQVLRQWLLPENFPLGPLPTGANTYFDTWATDPETVALLEETGRATQQTSAEGGLFRVFQPMGITPQPAVCDENSFNPPEECASDFYFKLANASPGTCFADNLCYTDTPDQETFGSIRPVDDRPLFLRTGMNFLQQSLRPFGL